MHEKLTDDKLMNFPNNGKNYPFCKLKLAVENIMTILVGINKSRFHQSKFLSKPIIKRVFIKL